MKFISLFSGIGGFDLGFERAGMECIAQVEIDKNCLKLLGDKFPNAERYTDVKGFDYGKSVDIITGGFPCQDVSVAGRRAGLAGERSGLWYEFHRIITNTLPRWVVIENVPGLLSSNKGEDFAVILRGLVECGYGVAWRILDAQYFGIPQRRRRVFIVGSLGNGRAAKVLFESEGLRGDIATGREAGQDVAYSLRANPSRSGDKGDGGINTTLINLANSGANQNNVKETEVMDTLDTWQSFAVYTSSSHGEYVEGVGTLRANGGDLAGGSESLIAGTLSVNYGKQGGNGMGTMENGLLTSYTPRRTNFDGIENLSPTLNPGGGGFGSPAVGVRRLTPVECERLQGFPDNWTAGFADTVRYRMLGNAVAVPCAEWIGRRILEAAQ